ncbi:type III secretion system stator protein SctL [Pseudochelatococcus sp. B33]
MAAYYRLSDLYRLEELGFRLSEGAQILPPEAFSPIAGATRLVDDARAQARAIVRDAENVREEERRRGFAEGLAQGRLEAIEQTLREARALDAHLEALEQDIADIVMVSVRKLIDSYDDAAKAEAVVRGALKQMRREKKAELRVAPEHFPRLRGAIDGILKDFPGFELIEVIEDATLSGSSVIVDTGIGRVEGDIGSRLDELATIVRGILPGSPAEADDNAQDPPAETEDREGDGGTPAEARDDEP